MHYYERIKNYRTDHDIKQYELANIIGVDKVKYNFYETGCRSMPIDILDKILIHFDISLDYILELSKEKKYPNMKPIDIANLHIMIKDFRLNEGLTQYEFASLINIRQQTLSDYERGIYMIPVDIIKLICDEFKISADVLTGRIKEEDIKDLQTQ